MFLSTCIAIGTGIGTGSAQKYRYRFTMVSFDHYLIFIAIDFLAKVSIECMCFLIAYRSYHYAIHHVSLR